MKEEGGGLNSQQLETLRGIKENNQKMIDLVNDLLIVSRAQKGKLSMSPQEVDLQKVIKDIFISYSSYAQASNVSLRFEPIQKLPLAFCDQEKIKLVLENIIDNAIRYSRSGGWVEARVQQKNKYLRCEIEDNGVGIPKLDQERVFQKFFRSQNIMRYQTLGRGIKRQVARSAF
jgi:signal transduction histidine kinase